jgi:TolB protein
VRLDDRARIAAEGIRRAVETPDTADPFYRYERGKRRNQRIGAGLLAAALAIAGTYVVGRAFEHPRKPVPAGPARPSGLILYGHYVAGRGQLHVFTVRADGSGERDLSIVTSCAQWLPDGSKILISNDAAFKAEGAPLRPATIHPDGSGLRRLDGASNRNLNLGCGDASPDGARLVLEGFNENEPGLNGIYVVRASDGGGLVRLTHNPYNTGDSYPQYSPDGTRVVFMRTKPGVNPDGAGAVFVVNADGTGLRRITPWGAAFLGQSWSPDGRWILFQRPYGRLYVVHPDGTRLHEIPVRLPVGSGAISPAWSPDGEWIVFSLERNAQADIYVVRADGSGLRRVTDAPGVETYPDWRPGG